MSHNRGHRNLGTTDADLKLIAEEPLGLDDENEAKLNHLLAKMRHDKHPSLTPMSEAGVNKNISKVIDLPNDQATEPSVLASSDRLLKIQNLADLRNLLNSSTNILIMDLEFYGVGNEIRIKQIAGQIYGLHEKFNYAVFNQSRMKPTEQLTFLKQTNFTFQQAQNYDSTNVIQRVNEFLKRQKVSYLLSFDNNLDLKCLNREAELHHWDDSLRFWQHLKLIDLAKIIRDSVLDGKLTISLSNLVGLLGIDKDIKFHRAVNDVEYINRILKLYSYDMSRMLI